MSDTVSLVKLSTSPLYSLWRWLLVLGLGILPFIYSHLFPVAYEIPRVWATIAWINLLLLLIPFVRIQREKIVHGSSVLLWLVWLFIVAAIGASLFGINWSNSLWGNYYRVDGLVTLVHLGVFASIVAFAWNQQWRHRVFTTLALGSLGVSLWIIFQAVGWTIKGANIFLPSNEFGGPFGQPVFAAGYLVVTYPAVVWLLEKLQRRWKWLAGIGVMVPVIALYCTKSWGALVVFILYSIFRIWIRTKKRWLNIFFLVLSGFIILSASAGTWMQLRASATSGIIVAEGRDRIYIKGTLGFLQRPIFGWGWANFSTAFAAADWPFHFYHDVMVDKAHGQLLEILVTTGLVGFAIYVFLLWKLFSRLLMYVRASQRTEEQRYWEMMFGIFLMYVLHSQTNVLSIAEELLFWFVVGVIAGGIHSPPPMSGGLSGPSYISSGSSPSGGSVGSSGARRKKYSDSDMSQKLYIAYK